MAENKVTFEKIEQEIYKTHLDRCREEFASILKELDDYVLSIVDKSLFQVVGAKEKVIKTIFGTVTFPRRLYRLGQSNGDDGTVYLLDELLNINSIGRLSTCVAQKVHSMRESNLSYRDISNALKAENNIEITRQAIPNILYAYENYISNKQSV